MEEKSALVIIDVQNSEMNKHTEKLPKKIRAYLKKRHGRYDYVLFSKFVNSRDSHPYKILGIKLAMGPPGTDIHKDLQEFVTKDNVFVKHGFSIFKNRKFVSFLKKKKVKNLFFCGLVAHSCVYASAIDAIDLGYKTRILTNLSFNHSAGSTERNATEYMIRTHIQKK